MSRTAVEDDVDSSACAMFSAHPFVRRAPMTSHEPALTSESVKLCSKLEGGLLTPPESEDEAGSSSPVQRARDKDSFPSTPKRLNRSSTIDHIGRRKQCSSPVSPASPSHKRKRLSDRFIPARDCQRTSLGFTETYRISKSPQDLLPGERHFRDDSASPDPFGPLEVSRSRSNRQMHASTPGPYGSTQPVYQPPGQTISLLNQVASSNTAQIRHTSAAAVWNVGGPIQASLVGPLRGVSNGRGGYISSGSNAPMYEARFLEDDFADKNKQEMERRLAVALELNQSSRTLQILDLPLETSKRIGAAPDGAVLHHEWKNGQWNIPVSSPILDAPGLRDDFYCTVLAYCHLKRTIAVGLVNSVYLWSEDYGVRYPPLKEEADDDVYVTSLAFSSVSGGNDILAIGRNNGHIALCSLQDITEFRFQVRQHCAIACVAFRPVAVRRLSTRFRTMTLMEDLLVGDTLGHIYYYSIEWMSQDDIDIHGWHGNMILLAKMEIHVQQICGLVWSNDGAQFVSGGNDNVCYLFDAEKVLTDDNPKEATKRENTRQPESDADPSLSACLTAASSLISEGRADSSESSIARSSQRPRAAGTREGSSITVVPGRNGCLWVGVEKAKCKWPHSAAVKAIAFSPWHKNLLATGGGSNDRAIHFWHTLSGACLATINVHAQVTSLVWSSTYREIAATLGYSSPEHPYRIAVFSWPECRQTFAVPWDVDVRACHAISYPGVPSLPACSPRRAPSKEHRKDRSGCLVVACSDETIKFHEVWSARGKMADVLGAGMLGGSSILEGLEGVDQRGRNAIR